MELTSSATGTWQDLVLLSAWHTCGAGGSLAREVLKFDARKRERESQVGWQVIVLPSHEFWKVFFEKQENQDDVGRASC